MFSGFDGIFGSSKKETTTELEQITEADRARQEKHAAETILKHAVSRATRPLPKGSDTKACSCNGQYNIVR